MIEAHDRQTVTPQLQYDAGEIDVEDFSLLVWFIECDSREYGGGGGDGTLKRKGLVHDDERIVVQSVREYPIER